MVMNKIVIVEDDEAIAQMYSFKFEAEGFKVAVAVNGQLGLDVIKEMQPEIILLDLMIPVMSGDKMLEAMRKEDWGVGIKVIVLTNISRADAPTVLDSLNVDRYIVKAQTTPSGLVEAVNEVLAKK
jgi:DNA-binding response OmpR family regulator